MGFDLMSEKNTLLHLIVLLWNFLSAFSS